MKKIVSLMVCVMLLMEVAFGYTLTLNYESQTITKEVDAGRDVIVGFPNRSWMTSVVNKGNVVLKLFGTRCHFVMPAEDVEITFKAIQTYTVSFESNGGSTVEEKSVTVGDVYGELPTPSKENYAFGGWHSDSEFTTQVTSSSIVEINGNHTLYAKWTVNEYTVTLDGGATTTVGTTSVVATYGSAMPAITVPTRTGYNFLGYYTSADGSGTQYYNSSGTSAKN